MIFDRVGLRTDSPARYGIPLGPDLSKLREPLASRETSGPSFFDHNKCNQMASTRRS